MNTAIEGGRLIDPANGIDEPANLYLADGRVAGVGHAPEGFSADLTVDAEGLVVCPGLVDLHARLREPGQEHKATIASETAAAARGGITTLCCPPDTDPVIDTPAVAAMVTRRAAEAGMARVLPIGALTQHLDGSRLAEIAALREAGCVAVGNADAPLANTLVERRALEYAASFGMTVVLRPEDRHLRDDGCVHEGPVSNRLGLPGIPAAAEAVAVARDLALAEHTGCRIHFHSLSSGSATRLLESARRSRPGITADVAAHQLHLTEMDIEGFDSRCHVSPPLRGTTDRLALREAVAAGVIGVICSDHQPHEVDAKASPFPATAPGISALETLLPLALRLVDEGVLPLAAAVARLTCGPADVLGLPFGRLTPGLAADVCLFDPRRSWVLTEAGMVSRGRNTPFIGWEFTGMVTHTFFGGRLVYRAD